MAACTAPIHKLGEQRLTQRREAIKRANARRGDLAAIRARLRRHELTVCDIVRDPPLAMAEEMVWKVLIRAPYIGTARLGELGDEAIRARVNLAAPLGMLSSRQREWLCEQLQGR